MKTFMVFVWVLIFGACLTGCTTLSFNESSLAKACKAGVSKYDDGNTSFECKDGNVKSFGKAHIGD
jgi:hypothetical protein